jgi:GT2 family glycosyltransferase
VLVSIIIVSYNVRHFLELCLHSVMRAAEGLEAEVIVVDNLSSDDSVAMVREKFPQERLPSVHVIANTENTGFSRANNQGVAIARGEYILFLNPDTVMPEDFLRITLAYLAAHPEAGALGPRLIDGRGRFAPDAKKAFPTFWVALSKSLGLGKLFPRSAFFNGYYAPHIPERQTAAVEVLSGCCMMTRRDVLQKVGGAFDEAYFMYCEDVDLSYRIRQAGYQNIYFPHTDLIHYKGESTRKATLSYVRIFNEALATFVRKHYSGGRARVFIGLLRAGIFMRAVLGVFKNAVKALRMPLFDALVLLFVLWGMKEFWVGEVKDILPIPLRLVALTFPVYVGLWIGSLFLNGAYDKPYRALRVVRGMLVGTVAALAFYGLLPAELRYSRAILVFGGLTGTVVLLGLHEIGRRLGVFNLPTQDTLPQTALIVAENVQLAEEATGTLRSLPGAPRPLGWVSVSEASSAAMGTLSTLRESLHATGAAEAIFCISGALDYRAVLTAMQHCGPHYEYKIHIPGSGAFVGSSSSAITADLLTADPRYNLSDAAHRRTKRLFDVVAAFMLLLISPLAAWRTKHPAGFLRACVSVLAGRRTWVGYAPGGRADGLPRLRPGIVPPLYLQEGYTPKQTVLTMANETYARMHQGGTDTIFLLRNFRFLGGQ